MRYSFWVDFLSCSMHASTSVSSSSKSRFKFSDIPSPSAEFLRPVCARVWSQWDCHYCHDNDIHIPSTSPAYTLMFRHQHQAMLLQTNGSNGSLNVTCNLIENWEYIIVSQERSYSNSRLISNALTEWVNAPQDT